MLVDIDREFEEAAVEFAVAQRAFMACYQMNVATDPVENQKQIADFEHAKGRLFEAQARLARARRAKYPDILY